MAAAKNNYEDWGHWCVECNAIDEMAADYERQGVKTLKAAIALERTVGESLNDRQRDCRED
jgi:hypothetical protein